MTPEEFATGKGDAEVFTLLDKNGDGVVTLDELGLPADYKPRPLPPPREEPPPDAKGAGPAGRVKKIKERFAAMDKDKDGKVSKEEYTGEIPFDMADRNKDGFLTAEDIVGAPGAGRPGGKGPSIPSIEEQAARMREADKNGDGKVGRDEWPGRPEGFERIDKDGDGFLTKEEFLAAAARGGAPGGPGAGKAGGPRKDVARFDRNGDGKVTRDEFPGGDDAFKSLDKDGDGAISAEEAKAARGDGKGPRGDGEAKPPAMPAMSDDPMAPPPAAPPPVSPPAEAPHVGGAAPTALFALLDRNHDGKISREEFPGGDDEWRKMDRDANGWVTPDEAAGR